MFPVLLSTRSHHRRHKVRRPLLSPWLQGLLLAFLLVGSTLALAAPARAFIANAGPAIGPDMTADAPTGTLTGAAAIEQLKASGQYESLAAAFNAARYAIQPSADGTDRWAQNPAHGLQATFTTQGLALTIQPATSTGTTPTTYRTVWQLTSLGYGDQQQPVPAGQLYHTGDRVEVVRANVTEWFINSAAGLEHGFTLPTPPAGRHTGTPLRLTIQVDGVLTPQVAADGQQLTLQDERGQVVLDYSKLQVWDATGTPLPAHLATTGRQVHLLVDDSNARYPLTIDPTFTQQAYLKAHNTDAYDGFSFDKDSLAVSGNTVVVGASAEASNATTINGDGSDNSAPGAGAAYVFVRNGTESGGTWSQQAYLKASNTESDDYFGVSVTVSGDTIVVGAPNEGSNATGVNGDGSDNSAPYAGAAYVFVRNSTESGGTWSQQAYLKANNAEESDQFGYNVAVSGDSVVVGAARESSNATGVNGDGADNSADSAGAAYVFMRSGTTWNQSAYLKASNTDAGDAFGASVAVSGNTVLVGAGYEASNATGVNGDGADNSADGAGAVYVFLIETTAIPQLHVQGNGVSISNGDSSPSSSDGTNFGRVAVQTSQQKSFTLRNDGDADLTVNNITLSNGPANGFSLVNPPSFPFIVAAGATQTITVDFTPTALGATTATLSITSNDTRANPYTFVVGGVSDKAEPEIDLQGNGVSIANSDSSPSSSDGSDFGTVAAGSSLVRTFTIRNMGLRDLTGITVSVSGDAVFQLSSPPAATVTADGSTTFAVTFTPTRPGRMVATVNIANNDTDENPYTFVVQGASPLPEIDLQGNSVGIVSGDTTPSLSDQTEFALVVAGSTLVRDFIIRNTGQANLTGIAATISGAGAFTISTLPAATVNAGGNTTLRVTFAPTSGGRALATVTIANSDLDENPYTFVVGGTGAAPRLDVQGNNQRIANGDNSPSLADGTDFGGVAQQNNARNTFALRNLGAAPLTVSTITFSGAHPADFSLVTPPALPLTLAPGATQKLTVQIRPSAAGVRTANLVVNNNDPANSAYSFALQNREVVCTVYPGGNTPLALPDQQAVAAAVVVPTDGQVADVNVRNVQIQHSYDGDLQFGLLSPTGTLVVLADRRGRNGRHYTNTTFDDAASSHISAGSAPFSNSYRPEIPLSGLNGSKSQGQWQLVFYDTAAGNTGTLTGWLLELCTLAAPNLSVRGNGSVIVHGDSTPSAFDQSYVGATTVNAPLVRTFAISNTGSANLTAVAVSVNGNTAFSISAQPAATVNAGGSSSFQLTFAPGSLGVVTATVRIASNDPNANPYTFVVQGAALEAPPVFLTGWGTEGAGNRMFNKPFGVAVDRNGAIYVADTFNHRIQQFDSDGTLRARWGAQGSGAGQFLAPFGIAVDSSGNVYVGDTLNHRIQKFSRNGAFLTQWGATGSGAGQFTNPKGLAVDSSGNVYVADSLNHRIQKFTSSGAFLAQWGLQGSGPGQFDGPANVAVDSRDPNQIYLYVADGNNHRIQKFTGNGVFLTQWGVYGGGAGQLFSPFGLAVDGSGNVYVADSGNDRIQKFSSTGSLLTQWGGTGVGAGRFLIPGAIATNGAGHVIVADTFNHRLQLFGPTGPIMAVTSGQKSITNGNTTPSTDNGTDFGRAIVTTPHPSHFTIKNVGTAPLTGVAVTVRGNSAFSVGMSPRTTLSVGQESDFLIRFDPSTRDIVTATVSIASNDPNASPYTFVVQGMGLEAPPAFFSDFGIKGGCYGLVAGPVIPALDSQGNLFIPDAFRHCMYKFNRSGSFLTQWGTQGSGNGQFDIPLAAAVDRNNNVYVVDSMNHRVQKFDNLGNFLTQWGSQGSGLRQFNTPVGIHLDRSDPTADYLWVFDGWNNRVLKYDTAGNFIANLGTLASLGQRPAQRGVAASARPDSNPITFNNPTGAATDSSGNIYVIDNDNSRLQKFDRSGAYLTTWATGISSSGQALRPTALAIDSRDPNQVKVYIADPVNNRIRQFDGNGAFVTEWGSTGSGPGEFNNPTGLLVDENGYLYVVDSGNQRIQIFGYPTALPVMAVQGNGIRIASGDSSPSLRDQTDLGGVITGNTLVRTYTISNSGGAALTGVAVSVNGDAVFSVSAQPAATISAGSSSTFQLSLAPTNAGEVTATVNISSNDPLAKPYTFVVQGLALATATPQSVVTGNDLLIANGDATPSDSEQTVLGGVTVGGVVSRTFTIYNRGTAELTGISASVNGNGAVQIASQPATTLPPGGSSTFVVAFTPSSVGTVTATVSIASNDSAANPYTFVVQGTGLETPLPFRRQWGTAGSEAGQFAGPYGVATDSLGNLYVVDGNNHRVQIFDRNGNFVTQWSTSASSNGQTASPYAIAVDSRDVNTIAIYVVDTSNHLVKKFDRTGTLLTFWGGYGRAAGQFNSPAGVAVDNSGNVYVTDSFNNRIQKFDSNGAFLAQWGAAGSAAGEFFIPSGIAVDSSGNVYVADSLNARIQKFDSSGGFLAQWGSYGSEVGQLDRPTALAIDGSGNLYVTDSGNHRLVKFTSSGSLLAQWGSYGSAAGEFSLPSGLATDSEVNLYVADTGNQRIQQFGPVAAITVTGNNIPLINNDSTPTASDNTDFGSVMLGSTPVVHTFTIGNNGVGTLDLYTTAQVTVNNGVSITTPISTFVSISGSDAFTVTTQPANRVAPNGTTNFAIGFAPTAAGLYTATVRIASSAPDVPLFSFVVQGVANATAVPQLGLSSQQAPNGGLFADTSNGRDFGVMLVSNTVTRTYTLSNTGNADLMVNTITLSGGTANAFAVSGVNLPLTIPAGSSSTFSIRLTPGATGLYTTTVHIANNDPSQNPLTFIVQGTAKELFAPEINISGQGVSIANGATPSSADGTDLGTVAVGAQRQQAFGLRNAGTADLTVSSLSFTGAHASDFSLVSPPSLPLTIAPNTSQTITVQLQPSVIGLRTANLVIASNDRATPSYTFGLQGSVFSPGAALDFDGNDDYVSLPATLNSQFAANQITVEGWFNPASAAGADAAGWRGLVSEDYPGDGNVKFTLFQVSSTINCGFFTGTWYWVSTPITLNTWQHIACTYDQQAIKLYVNGAQTGSQLYIWGVPAGNPEINVALPAGTGAWYLGRRWDAAGYYQGRMDEVRIWNRALPQAEIQSGLNCEQPSSTNGLVARYGFNQGTALSDNSSVTTLTDSGTNSLNGALTNFSLNGSASTWVEPGAVTSGVICGTSPDIAVQGKGVTIANGDSTPDTSNDTAFGSITVGTVVTHTFTISNGGTADLTGVAVTFTGNACAAAAQVDCAAPVAFRLVSAPAATIAAGSSSTFVVAFEPGDVGAVQETISIASNDSDENPYTFAISGEGVAPPPQAIIQIVLDAQPNLPTNLGFQSSFGPFLLDDPTVDDGDAYTNTKSFTVAPGSYTVRRNNPASWFTTAISCTPDGKATIDLPERRAAITVAAGDTVTCTYTVTRGVKITARAFNDLMRRGANLGKRNGGDPWQTGWNMSVAITPTAPIATGVTGGSGAIPQASFINLRPGSYVVCTTLPAGSWTPTTPTANDPVYGQPCKTITLTAGQSATLLFGAYAATVVASENVAPEDELITDEDTIGERPYDPAEDETATAEEGAQRLFLPLINR